MRLINLKLCCIKTATPLFGKCIKNNLDKILAPKTIVSTVPKKDLVIPYHI